MHGNPNVWLAGPEAAQHFDPAQLTAEERARSARLRRSARRQEFAVSRALRAHARLAAAQPASESLSHSGGYAAVAHAHRSLRVGVDLEMHRTRDVLAIARMAFNEAEAHALQAASAPEREQLFYAMWTVKEALAKALGMQLMEALRCCELVVDGSSWHVCVPRAAAGRVAVYQPRTGFTLAVACVATDGATDHVNRMLPIGSWSWPPQRPASWPLIAAISLRPAAT